MNGSKKSSEEEPCRDWLSELPDWLIFEIFGFLPMRDVVRTTVLSKRWNNLWTTTPYLNFGRCGSKFVYKALTLWEGFKIHKLKICLVGLEDLWLNVKDHGVEEFDFEQTGALHCFPQNLYSCSSLKVLTLRGCNLEQIAGTVQWNQLRSLTIEGGVFEEIINKVLSGSPQLEVFILTHWPRDEKNISIRSSSLKKLSIRQTYRSAHPPAKLRIWSPNLETLDLLGEPYDRYSITNAPSLTQLTLHGNWREEFDGGERLGQILQTNPHVEKLTLSGDWIKVVGDMFNHNCGPSPLSNLISLTIHNEVFTAEVDKQMVNFLLIFPQLETLVIQSIYNLWQPRGAENHHDCFVHVEANLPEFFPLQLRTVEINYCENDSFILIPLVEILLKHARNLQKMVFRLKGFMRPFCSTLQQEVVRMQSCSPTAELIFANY